MEGYALAGGFELVLACDIDRRVARRRSSACPRSSAAWSRGRAALLRLPRRIPYHVAMEIALTGEHFPASRLYEVGLVNQLTSARARRWPRPSELAARIAANAPLALAATKRVIVESADWRGEGCSPGRREIINPVFGSKDAMEGAAAFAEKRPPNWSGE